MKVDRVIARRRGVTFGITNGLFQVEADGVLQIETKDSNKASQLFRVIADRDYSPPEKVSYNEPTELENYLGFVAQFGTTKQYEETKELIFNFLNQ